MTITCDAVRAVYLGERMEEGIRWSGDTLDPQLGLVTAKAVAGLIDDAGFAPADLGGLTDASPIESPRRPGAVYGEEYRPEDARTAIAALRVGQPLPPAPRLPARRASRPVLFNSDPPRRTKAAANASPTVPNILSPDHTPASHHLPAHNKSKYKREAMTQITRDSTRPSSESSSTDGTPSSPPTLRSTALPDSDWSASTP